jgi:hypothetical protein
LRVAIAEGKCNKKFGFKNLNELEKRSFRLNISFLSFWSEIIIVF